jgi:uncharacterized protein YecE (DUF72 family)
MNEPARQRLLVGTSGFSYPDWRGEFYPETLPPKRWLGFYAERFNSVEINLTFYRPASAATLTRWRECTPNAFAFAFKASRVITHDKKLIDCRPELETFARQLAPMGGRLACALFQLPPSLKAAPERLSAFLDATSEVFESAKFRPHLALEFRHPSWYSEETLALLRRHDWTVVVHDMMKAGGWAAADETLSVGETTWRFADFLGREAPFLYLRFHGPTGCYQGEYGIERLKRWAPLARLARRRDVLVLAFFNNTMAAAAPRDAAAFEELLRRGHPSA